MASALVVGPVLLAAADPTTSYAPTNYIKATTASRSKVTVQFALVWSSSTSIEWYYEWSPDGTNWYRSINLASAAGVNTATANSQTIVLGASTKWEDCLYVQDVFFRVQVKRTGGSASDTVAVSVTQLDI